MVVDDNQKTTERTGSKIGEKSQEEMPSEGKVGETMESKPPENSKKPPAEPEITAEEMRLPRSLIPVRYDLKIKTYFPSSFAVYDKKDEFGVDGELRITMKCMEKTSTVILNSKNLNISQDSVILRNLENSAQTFTLTKFEEKKDRDMVAFHFNIALDVGEYELVFNYRGSISEELNGFYRAHYMENGQKRWLGVTQFEPIAARKAFPGFDEPNFKAVFGLTIEHPSEYEAISNAMNVSLTKKTDGWTVTKFGDSPKMSSYLVAFAVCEFVFSEKRTKRGTLFRIWARPSLLHQTAYAAEMGTKVLEFFEDYYKIPFPLEKQDMIALPDFKSGAMENWGLITYREKYLLFDESVYSLSNKQSVAAIIAHELAHQWFGNLVTMNWWDDLWLNEGFASFMEYIAVENATNGAFDIQSQFVALDFQRAIAKDGLASSHPLFIHIGKAHEVNDIFDTITYQKGSSTVRMVMEVMGYQDFRSGLTNYLTKHAYANAEHNDLWNSLSKTAHVKDWNGKTLNVTEFADPWTIQMGFPLVTVNRNYSTGTVNLSQERFKLDRTALDKEQYRNPKYKFKWHIPLWYQSQENTETVRDWFPMSDNSKVLELKLNPGSWVLMNSGVKAFYRTQYDEKTWNQLANQLVEDHTVIPVESRSQLIDDAFTLAKAGMLSYETALNLTRYLHSEHHYVPWSTAINHLHRLAGYFKQTESYGFVKQYMLKIITPAYEAYGWNFSVPENDVLVQKLQSVTVGDTCAYGHSDCLKIAKKKFESLRSACSDSNSQISSSCNSISPHLRYKVYCNGIKHGDADTWEFVWNKYLTENIGVEKSRLGAALTCTKEPWLLIRLLNEAIKGKNVRRQDTSTMYYYVARNSVGRLMIWRYFNKEWENISSKLSSFSMRNSIIRSSTSGMDSMYDISELDDFVEKHPSAAKYSAFKDRKEQIKIKSDWLERNFDLLTRWFKDQV